jgi:hypothetical protein
MAPEVPAMAKKAKPKKQTEVVIPQLPVETVSFLIVGTSPLLTNRFHPLDQAMLAGSQTGKAKATTNNRSPEDEYERSLWRIDKDTYGYPAHNMIQAFIGGCRNVEKVTMAGTRGTVDILSTQYGSGGDELVPIINDDDPRSWSRVVGGARGSKKAIKYCARFDTWSMAITATYDPRLLTASQFLLAWQCAGAYIGIGGWRPECSGRFGKFRIE